MPTRLIATSLALIAFATAVLVGLATDNAAATVLWRALVAMIGCYFAGLLIGGIAHRALQEQIERYKQEHPLEPDEADSSEPSAGGDAASDPSADSQPSTASAAAGRTAPSETSQAVAS